MLVFTSINKMKFSRLEFLVFFSLKMVKLLFCHTFWIRFWCLSATFKNKESKISRTIHIYQNEEQLFTWIHLMTCIFELMSAVSHLFRPHIKILIPFPMFFALQFVFVTLKSAYVFYIALDLYSLASIFFDIGNCWQLFVLFFIK